jgi:hypothetical protein
MGTIMLEIEVVAKRKVKYMFAIGKGGSYLTTTYIVLYLRVVILYGSLGKSLP